MKKLIILLLITGINIHLLNAQREVRRGKITPGGTFDVVFDRFGSRHNLEDLRINTTPPPKPKGGDRLDENFVTPIYSSLLCTSGYFNLYFEKGSGFEMNTPVHIARRDVLCQLFDDISNFIVPVNPATKVNILIRHSSYVGNPYALAVATPYYTLPTVTPTVGGIIDGQVWKTINSGVDAYSNVASPLIHSGPSGAFYHGMMAFNFKYPFHTNLTTATGATDYDLYSVALHEAAHVLGFASLISSSGGSVFGVDYPYYSRYDLNLTDFSSAPLIITNSACSMYEYEFNPSLLPAEPVLAPNLIPTNPCILDYTDCLLAIIYAGSVNQAVFTPNCWEQGSSLSHFEDECYLPTPYPNNQYYTMSNATDVGSTYMKRYLKPEERSVLCDIGYTVNTTYGNMLYTANNYNYGGTQCTNMDIAGVNDGMSTGGAYAWTTTVSGTININGSDLIGNDYNTDAFECLEVINGLGTISPSSGNAATSITFNAGTIQGVVLLRYIPVNTTSGNRGNITYAYMFIQSGPGLATACNMIMNEGFENGSNCGEVNAPDNAAIDCWEPLIETPDYFVRSCTPTINPDVTIPTGSTINIPAGDSWNGSGNDAFLGLGFYGGAVEEVEQTLLSTPMAPGVSYTLSFWAKSANAGPGGLGGANNIVFRGETGILTPLPSGSYGTTGYFLTNITVPDDGEWHYYTREFTHSAPNPLTTLMVGNVGNSTGNDSYLFVDDLTMAPTALVSQFKPPRGLCAGVTTLADLSKYIYPSMAVGSTITGPGVSFSGGIYSFTASGNGWYTIFYNYTNVLGCNISVPAKMLVTPASNPTVSVAIDMINTPIPPVPCFGWPVNLVASGAKTYAWIDPPIYCQDTCDSMYVAAGDTIYLMGIDSLGCMDTTSIYVPGVPCFGGGGIPPTVKTFEMPDDVKHYTTKSVSGTRNYSVLAGTIFKGGVNAIHFLLLDKDGNIIVSKEYTSAYTDERVVDIQPFTDKYKVTRWYIVCHANAGQNIIKVLCVNNVGTLIDQREYRDMMGQDTYPMSAAVWQNGTDRRLFITGYQTPGGSVLDYGTPKHVFLSSIDINRGATHMNAISTSAYDFNMGWGGMYDYDIATRIAVTKGTNELWITGSTNGKRTIFVGGPVQPPDRSATLNLVVDPVSGTIKDNHFIENVSSDDYSGPLEYGIDLIQVGGLNYILGNSSTPDISAASFPFLNMEPRTNKLWWLQEIDANFAPVGSRQLFNNVWHNWASQAIPIGGTKVVIGSLIESHYSTCIPLPNTPSPHNVQVNMITVDLSGPTPTAPNHIYMTNTGTGNVGWFNSYHDLGGALSLMDYPPKFADMGNSNLVINAPKFMNGKLNLKVMTPTTSLSIPCGDWDKCNSSFIPLTITGRDPGMSQPPADLQPAISSSVASLYTVPGGTSCHDAAGNSSYKAPFGQNEFDELPEKTSLYPNPASTEVEIELARDIVSGPPIIIALTNLLGQKVATLYTGPASPRLTLTLPDLPDGVYFIEIMTDDKSVFNEKLMIKH